jgi:hypothetical protein
MASFPLRKAPEPAPEGTDAFWMGIAGIVRVPLSAQAAAREVDQRTGQVRPVREPAKGWSGSCSRNQIFCPPSNDGQDRLDTIGNRGFSGARKSQGHGRFVKHRPNALILMGDWCVPAAWSHKLQPSGAAPNIENQGAYDSGSKHGRRTCKGWFAGRREGRKTSQRSAMRLDTRGLMGDPSLIFYGPPLFFSRVFVASTTSLRGDKYTS